MLNKVGLSIVTDMITNTIKKATVKLIIDGDYILDDVYQDTVYAKYLKKAILDDAGENPYVSSLSENNTVFYSDDEIYYNVSLCFTNVTGVKGFLNKYGRYITEY